jgi:hypothetical protein
MCNRTAYRGAPTKMLGTPRYTSDALPKNMVEPEKKIISLLGDVKTHDGQIGQLLA